MNRFDRALAILLLLRSEKTLSAPDLARRLSVSVRTIYRDMETLSVGVPIYAEVGREGGFRLVEGYFLPPIAFTVGEATSLLTGLALLDRLRSKPFAAELDTATRKLLAVVPDSLRDVLSQAQRVIGFEAIPEDIFHPEQTHTTTAPSLERDQTEVQAITVFLKCIFEKRIVLLSYASPYKSVPHHERAIPYGILWDRDRWYLIGRRVTEAEKLSFWRADRVVSISPDAEHITQIEAFTTESLLNRQWLDEAMTEWARLSPVVIQMRQAQAERLKRDWYYAHALYETVSAHTVRMTFGENNQSFVFELLRWLGPGAELIEPRAWRQPFADELRAMSVLYQP